MGSTVAHFLSQYDETLAKTFLEEWQLRQDLPPLDADVDSEANTDANDHDHHNPKKWTLEAMVRGMAMAMFWCDIFLLIYLLYLLL